MTPATDASPEDVVRSYLASFATGDADAIAAHVANSFVNDHASALGEGCTGADEYRRRLVRFLAAFRALRYEVETVIADGPHVAAAYRMTATSDGHPVDIRGAMLFEVRHGIIERRTDYWDSLTFMRQTGQTGV